MAHPLIWTAADAVQHAVGYLGGAPTASGMSEILRAVQTAYRVLTESRRWTYLLKFDRVRVQAPYSTGTIEYDHTGGSSERLVTLTTGTFPTWMGATATTPSNASIRIANKIHKVSYRLTSTTLQLDSNNNPGEDVAASTAYLAFLSAYQLPNDFVTLDIPYDNDVYRFGRYVRPNEWLARERFGEGTGAPNAFTVIGDANNLGYKLLHTLYVPTATEELDYFYCRYPREVRFFGRKSAESQGTIAVSTTAVTGTGTAFSSAMVGSILRISDTTTVPTGLDGLTPYFEQRLISAYSSATSITLAASATTASGVAYLVSDPLDIDPIMVEALQRGIEKQLAILKDKRTKDEAVQLYDEAYARAASIDDSRNYLPRQVGDGKLHGSRGADVESPDKAA